MPSPEQKKKLERLQSVLSVGGETKDLVLLDALVEELSQRLDITAQSIVDAIERLQYMERPEPVVNVEAPVVNIEPQVVNVEPPVVNVEAPIVNLPPPVVNIEPQVVNVEAPIVNVEIGEVLESLKQILTELKTKGNVDLEKALSKFIKDDRIKVNVDRVGGIGGVVTFPIVDALLNQDRNKVQLQVRIDDVSTTSVVYVGKSAIGSSASSPLWQIQKIDRSGSPESLIGKWAGSGLFNQIWSDRTTLSYS